MYRIRFRDGARTELDFARAYFIYDRIVEWIRDLAEDAESKPQTRSIDFESLLESIDTIESTAIDFASGNWRRSLLIFRKSPILDQVKALLVVLRRREAPWQFAASSVWFTQILQTLDAEIHVFYEIDHVNKQIIIVKFSGLPGQGS